MKYRQFGNTDLNLSEIGFGAWAIGGNAMIGNTAIGWGKSDDSVSIKAIHAALDAGINFFDTADIYGLGHSELLLGNSLATQKDIIIATKVGNVNRNEVFTIDYSKAHILQACEASLKRLKRTHIDYYQLHTARLQHLENGECIDAMQQLQREGKIRYWGLSLNTFEPETDARFLMSNQLGSGFQLVLNMLNQIALNFLDDAAQKNYGIIARMPLQFGLLSGKFDHQLPFDDTDHRKKRITAPIVQAVRKQLTPAWELCKKYNCSKAQLALSFILSFPQVSTVIPGIRTPEQALLNTSGLVDLSLEDQALIKSLYSSQMMDMIQKQG